MTKNSKIILGIVIAVLVVAGIWLAMRSSSTNNSAQSMQYGEQGGTGMNNAASVSSTDTSDAALSKDMTSLDAQMSGLDSENAQMDQSASAQ